MSVAATEIIFLSPLSPLVGQFTVSLVMDGVRSVQSLPPSLATFNVSDDPRMDSFDKKEYKGEILTLTVNMDYCRVS